MTLNHVFKTPSVYVLTGTVNKGNLSDKNERQKKRNLNYVAHAASDAEIYKSTRDIFFRLQSMVFVRTCAKTSALTLF
jgi:hypothetical protein